MKNWHQRLTFAREKRKIKKSAFAKLVGVSAPTVTDWENGDTKRMDGENLVKVCRALDITADWLLYGDGIAPSDSDVTDIETRFIDAPPAISPGSTEYNVTPLSSTGYDVPIISWVAAGTWSIISDPYEPGVASEWLPCPKNHSASTFALRVRGVSMENIGGKHSYSDGDVIFVDPAKHYENGSRVIVRLDDRKEAAFKQLVIEGDHKYLKALNPAWPEKIIEINSNATICGVVIGKWIDE